MVAADVDPGWLATAIPPDAPGDAFNPPFLGALETMLGLRVGNIDLLTMAPRLSGRSGLDLRQIEDQTHPRVRRALRYRTDLTVWTCPGGVVLIGRGVGGRWEVAFEVEPAFRGRSVGR